MNNQYVLSVTDKKVDHMGQIDELTLLYDFCSLGARGLCISCVAKTRQKRL